VLISSLGQTVESFDNAPECEGSMNIRRVCTCVPIYTALHTEN